MVKTKLMIRKINTFIKIDFKSKYKFGKVFLYMGIARAFILFVPFNKLRKSMGKIKEESPDEVDINTYKQARDISEVISIVSRHTPWESKCLVQAFTAQKMLKEKGISTTIYLGVKKDKDNNMLAHAWIRCGKYYVTGGSNKEGYAVVAKFAN